MHLNARERSANKELIELLRPISITTRLIVVDEEIAAVLKAHPKFKKSLARPALHKWASEEMRRLIRAGNAVPDEQGRLFPELAYIPRRINFVSNGKIVHVLENEAFPNELDLWFEQTITKNMHRVETRHAYYADYIGKIHSLEKRFGRLTAGELRKLAVEHHVVVAS